MDIERFIQGAFRAGLFHFKSVVSNQYSHLHRYYADIRAISSHPDLFREAVGWCSSVLESKRSAGGRTFESICGVETASLPLAGAITFDTGIPSLYLRTKPKGYGLGKVVEGTFQHGDSVYLVDDLTVTAAESMVFIESAEREGLRVLGLIVLYEKMIASRCRDVFVGRGYEYYSMFSYRDVSRFLERHHESMGLEASAAEIVRAQGEDAEH